MEDPPPPQPKPAGPSDPSHFTTLALLIMVCADENGDDDGALVQHLFKDAMNDFLILR